MVITDESICVSQLLGEGARTAYTKSLGLCLLVCLQFDTCGARSNISGMPRLGCSAFWE